MLKNVVDLSLRKVWRFISHPSVAVMSQSASSSARQFVVANVAKVANAANVPSLMAAS